MYKVKFLKTLIQSKLSKKNALENINLSATRGTLVTKGETESNFLTTLTDDPKLNH